MEIHLGNLIISLSDAMDLAHPALIRHQQRVAYVVWKMANAAGLSPEQTEKLYFAALLHDIGAFSIEEKKALMKHEVMDISLHCIRGELVLARTPWLKELSGIIRFHHTEWQEWDKPIDDVQVFESQILFLADYLDRLIRHNVYILHQREGLNTEIETLSGTLFHPQIIEIFREASHPDSFWLDIASPKIHSILLREGPFGKKIIGIPDLFQISELFRNIIDFRSRFTSTHSSGVASAAGQIAKYMDFPQGDVMLMEIAGNLHDIGKLAIPNRILNKPAKLTKKEMSVMKSHTYYTYSIIKVIGGLDKIAGWAAFHHEKLDGSGYPFGLKTDNLSTGARIMMVADIFTALVEDRPYRSGMSEGNVINILQQLGDRHLLDREVVRLVIDNHKEIAENTLKKQAEVNKFYNDQFVFLGENI